MQGDHFKVTCGSIKYPCTPQIRSLKILRRKVGRGGGGKRGSKNKLFKQKNEAWFGFPWGSILEKKSSTGGTWILSEKTEKNTTTYWCNEKLIQRTTKRTTESCVTWHVFYALKHNLSNLQNNVFYLTSCRIVCACCSRDDQVLKWL